MTETSTRDERIEQIRRAAVDVFAEHGFRRTSMALIADAVGVSRSALYQYYDNREDVFRAVIEATHGDAADAAIAALEGDGDLATRLSGYLQRGLADGYERLSTLTHAEEILEAQHAFAADIAEAARERRRGRLVAVLRDTGASESVVASAVRLLDLSPMGLKSDAPSVGEFRDRLDDLARSVAVLVSTSV